MLAWVSHYRAEDTESNNHTDKYAVVAITGVTKEQCAALQLENEGPDIARAA